MALDGRRDGNPGLQDGRLRGSLDGGLDDCQDSGESAVRTAAPINIRLMC